MIFTKKSLIYLFSFLALISLLIAGCKNNASKNSVSQDAEFSATLNHDKTYLPTLKPTLVPTQEDIFSPTHGITDSIDSTSTPNNLITDSPVISLKPTTSPAPTSDPSLYDINDIKPIFSDLGGIYHGSKKVSVSLSSKDIAVLPEKLAELTGMQYHYFAKAVNILDDDGWFGNGFISRVPIVKAETIPIPDPEEKTGDQLYETRCILKATLENGYTVLCTHFGLNHDEHINAVETVLTSLEKEKCILMGDFNVRRENEILLPIRECMKDTADVFSEPLVSFPSDKPNRKIDYIFVTPDVKVLEADIPAIVASDHRPHTATIK